jgi:hypothetical protein
VIDSKSSPADLPRVARAGSRMGRACPCGPAGRSGRDHGFTRRRIGAKNRREKDNFSPEPSGRACGAVRGQWPSVATASSARRAWLPGKRSGAQEAGRGIVPGGRLLVCERLLGGHTLITISWSLEKFKSQFLFNISSGVRLPRSVMSKCLSRLTMMRLCFSATAYW